VGLRIRCPTCGSRPYTEFWFGGEVPDPDDPEFERVWLRRNAAGRQTERWFHAQGCRRWLTVERDTRTNEVHGVA
jgi:heterotetrameric sarcosine oxidase delta subunit